MDELVKKLLELMKLEYKERKFNDTKFDLTKLINNEIRSLKIIKKEGFVKKIVNGIKKFFGLNRSRIYIPE